MKSKHQKILTTTPATMRAYRFLRSPQNPSLARPFVVLVDNPRRPSPWRLLKPPSQKPTLSPPPHRTRQQRNTHTHRPSHFGQNPAQRKTSNPPEKAPVNDKGTASFQSEVRSENFRQPKEMISGGWERSVTAAVGESFFAKRGWSARFNWGGWRSQASLPRQIGNCRECTSCLRIWHGYENCGEYLFIEFSSGYQSWFYPRGNSTETLPSIARPSPSNTIIPDMRSCASRQDAAWQLQGRSRAGGFRPETKIVSSRPIRRDMCAVMWNVDVHGHCFVLNACATCRNRGCQAMICQACQASTVARSTQTCS